MARTCSRHTRSVDQFASTLRMLPPREHDLALNPVHPRLDVPLLSDPIERRRAMARRLGASVVIVPMREDLRTASAAPCA